MPNMLDEIHTTALRPSDRGLGRLPMAEMLALAALIAVVFGRTLGHALLLWDDWCLIVQNPYVTPPSMKMAIAAWWHPHAGLYVPVTYCFWMLTATIAQAMGYPDGVGPVPFHLASLVVHCGNAMLVFWLIWRLLGGTRFAAFLGAAVFAIHPLQVEPVSWVSSMKDLLSTALMLLACFGYLKSREARRSNVSWYCLALLMAWFAVLAKPSAIILVPIVFAIECILLDRPVRGCLVRLLPFVLVGILPTLWTRGAQPVLAAWDMPWALRPQIAAYALCHYLRQTIWPFGFTIDYGETPLRIIMGGWGPWCCVILIALLLLILRLPRAHRRVAMAGLVIFVGGLAPVMGFAPFVFQRISTTGDRYAYGSMIGVGLIVAYVAGQWPRRWALAGAALLLTALGVLSIRQGQYWVNDPVLMTRAAELNPLSHVAAVNLALTPYQGVFVERQTRKGLLLNDAADLTAYKQMWIMCVQRQEFASAAWYGRHLLQGHLLGVPDPRDVAMDAIIYAKQALQAGDPIRAEKFLAVAGKYRPDLPSYKTTCAELEKMRAAAGTVP